MAPLPVDGVIPAVLDALDSHRAAVLEAAPGAGKTTRVPPALLRFGPALVLEPRRLAARMAARRVASEMGERVGETTGYQVRFEEAAGPRTRLRYLTEGVLTRRLLSDPRLQGVATVVLDEFHERHLDGDVALALLRRLPHLRLLVMSATMDTAAVARYLGGCPVIRSEGRLFDTRVEYTPHSAAPIEQQVSTALDRLLQDGLDGDVLVFLPGAAEIRRCLRACAPACERASLLALPLHGDLSPEEQDRAVQPSLGRKVIFSTNVAESSVTIDGVTVVIDSGLARIAADSPHTGLPELTVARISQASAAQRAGRAGRTRPGRVLRLYPREDLLRRPAHDTAEIHRRELSSLCLELRGLNLRPDEIDWFEPPPQAALAAADALLDRLGATPEMARLPLHPRLAALVLEASRRNAAELACAAAAVLSAGDRLPDAPPRQHGPSDILALLDQERSHTSRRIEDQIRRAVRPKHGSRDEQGLLIALLRAFPDRLARRQEGDALVLAAGGSARLARSSTVAGHKLLLAIDGAPLVRLASAVQPEWLIDLFPRHVEDRASLEWNRAAGRVEAVSALLYDGFVFDESRGGPIDPGAAAELLAVKALEDGLARFTDIDEVEAFRRRVAFAAEHSSVAPLTDDDLRAALAALASGLRSFADLTAACRDGAFLRALEARLDPAARQSLDRIAPDRIRLPSGRNARIRYEPGRPPVVASRLQDFFGLRETPRIAAGKVPLLVELLAPNQRPVQTTTDLAGFWQRLYPQVRRELMRRYPRHAWPENPLGGC